MYLPEQRVGPGFPALRRFAAAALTITAAALTPVLHQANATQTVDSPANIPHAELNPSDSLENIVSDVTNAEGFRYGTRDNNDDSMDTLKIIDKPGGGYLGVYHVGNTVKLATSNDLLNWQYKTDLDDTASQPTIFPVKTGGYLTAVEFNQYDNGSPTGAKLRIRYYPDTESLLNNNSTKEKIIKRTLSACNEGTPAVLSYRGNKVGRSVITLTFHYQKNCKGDRQAIGTLINFKKWTAKPDKKMDKILLTKVGETASLLGGLLAPIVPGRGSVGDRDHFSYQDMQYSIYEAQSVTGDFSTWRTFLYNHTTGQSTYIPIKTHRGSKSFANHTLSWIKSSSGKPVIAITTFVHDEEAAPGEAGTLVYYYKTDKTS